MEAADLLEVRLRAKLLLTPEEAGILIGVSRAEVYKLIQRGVIPAINLGGQKVPTKALEECVDRLAAMAAGADESVARLVDVVDIGRRGRQPAAAARSR